MGNIKKAFMTFGGVKRRFSETFRNGMVIVDDYAHHPEGDTGNPGDRTEEIQW